MQMFRFLQCSVMAVVAMMANIGLAHGAGKSPEMFTLDNGLRVVVGEDNTSPTVSIAVLYHVGSKNEKPGQRGFSHLFEHLMFSGSEHHPGEYIPAVRNAGGSHVAGAASSDYTFYYQVVPNTALETVLWMESDRMGYLLGAIDQAKLDIQRGVVKSEIGIANDEVGGMAIYKQLASFYPSEHPYSWRPLGIIEEINAASMNDVKQWFTDYYGAANAVISIVGDVRTEETLTLVKKYFANVRSGPPVARTREWIAGPVWNVYDEMSDRVSEPVIEKWWPAPGRRSDDVASMMLLEAILGGGKNSLLYRELITNQKLASSVQVEFAQKELMSQFKIKATAAGAGDRQLSAAIDEALERFIVNGPDVEDLKRAQVAIKLNKAIKNERGLQRAFDYAVGVLVAGDPRLSEKQLARIDETSVTDVQAAASKWLSRAYHEMSIKPLPDYEVAEDGADRSQLPAPGKLPDPIFPDIGKFTLDNGLEVYLVERHAIPMVSLTMQIGGGAGHDGDKPGLAGFALDMLDEGLKHKSAEEISDLISGFGGTLNVHMVEEKANVTLSSISDELSSAVTLFSEMISEPAFREEDIERLRDERISLLNRTIADFQETLRYLLPLIIYGKDHPYGRFFAGIGTHRSIAAINRENLLDYHQNYVRPANARLIVVGDSTEAQLKPLLNKAFSQWKNTGNAATAETSKAINKPGRPRLIMINQPGTSQSTILATRALDKMDVKQEAALFVFNDILGAISGSRIYSNLREEKGWSYGAFSMTFPKRHGTAWVAVAFVRANKTVESVKELVKEFDGITGGEPVTEVELAASLNKWNADMIGALEGNSGVMKVLMDDYSLDRPDSYNKDFLKALKNITLDEVSKMAEQVINPDEMTWFITGDFNGREKEIEALGLGEVEYWKNMQEALTR